MNRAAATPPSTISGSARADSSRSGLSPAAIITEAAVIVAPQFRLIC